jgi:hypothetical protein
VALCVCVCVSVCVWLCFLCLTDYFVLLTCYQLTIDSPVCLSVCLCACLAVSLSLSASP